MKFFLNLFLLIAASVNADNFLRGLRRGGFLIKSKTILDDKASERLGSSVGGSTRVPRFDGKLKKLEDRAEEAFDSTDGGLKKIEDRAEEALDTTDGGLEKIEDRAEEALDTTDGGLEKIEDRAEEALGTTSGGFANVEEKSKNALDITTDP